MSKSIRGILEVVGIIVVFTLLVSCSSASTAEVISSASVDTEETTIDVQDDSETSAEPPSASGEEINSNLSRLPEDIPIMPGARKLEVTQDASNISYEVDGTIDDVVTFYQDELLELGWEMTRSPDNVVGAMATMARTNEEGDRLTFSLQYNPMGEFVVVRIVRLSAP